MFQFDQSRAGIVIKICFSQEVRGSDTTCLFQHITPNEASLDPTKLLLWLFRLVWMILVWVCKYMNKFAESRAGTVLENVFLQSAYSSTWLFQHHTQWSFSRSNQTSFMTIWIGMNDTSMVLLVYVPVWSIQGRNCNQKWTSTGSVCFYKSASTSHPMKLL